MRRMDHLAIKDILKKRQVRTAHPSIHEMQLQQPTLISTHKQITIEGIVQKIAKSENRSNHLVELSTEQKYVIIEFMSERENISYNRNTLVNLMSVWACYNVTWINNNPDFKHSSQNKLFFNRKPLKNFFLLTGYVNIYDALPDLHEKDKSIDDSYDLTFQTQSKPLTMDAQMEGVEPRAVVEEHTGWGPLFRKKQDQIPNAILKIINSIIIEVEPPQFEGMLVNLGGMDQQKKYKILQHFPIFSNISKKMMSILPHIGLKKYSKNEYIYKMKQIPEAIYLILKGQIVFEVRVEMPKQKKTTAASKNHPNEFMIQTEALGIGNYFGEQQVIAKTTRQVNTICNSAQCDLLEIPIQKFEKLLTYSDFYEEVKNAAEAKIYKRKEKLEKSTTIYQQFSKSPEKSIDEPEMQQKKINSIENRRLSIKKKATEPVRVMHGNVIRKIPNRNLNEQVNFSMLGANPDMYEATLKKFRKYTMKAPEKYKPQVNWNLKRVWKVLNLQSILREDAEVTSPQGRKFYQSHRRLQNHVQEVKSLRPKTSSSTYRTKLQYIAYLQQFNN